MTIELDKQSEALLQAQLASGHYVDPCAVIADALLALEEKSRLDANEWQRLDGEARNGYLDAVAGRFVNPADAQARLHAELHALR